MNVWAAKVINVETVLEVEDTADAGYHALSNTLKTTKDPGKWFQQLLDDGKKANIRVSELVKFRKGMNDIKSLFTDFIVQCIQVWEKNLTYR